MNTITENTLFPLSLVISMVGALVWATKMYSDLRSSVKEAKQRISTLEGQVEVIRKASSEASERMARIETKVDILISRA